MTMISRLDEDKITHGEDWGTLGKKWRKIPRRGIGCVSVEEARVFASADDCFVRPGVNLVTTREVLAEEMALLAAVKAGRGAYSEVGSGSHGSFSLRLWPETRNKQMQCCMC